FGTFVKKKQSKKVQGLYKVYTIHKKKYGDCLGIEDVICKKKHQYEQRVKQNPSNYNTWFYYLYAIFEKLETKDIERCREVHKVCLELISQKRFIFSKIWLYYAYVVVIRQKNVAKTKKRWIWHWASVGRTSSIKVTLIWKRSLLSFDRCRKLYVKFLELSPENCATVVQFAEVETRHDKNARQLFERLIERTLHVKVSIVYAKFELLNPQLENNLDNVTLARCIFERKNNASKNSGDIESRVLC
ncbi:protein crooked neck-like, partial [Pseudomyrmex gracilis]|uniref:protein crooked neck-like n=1 Tax=Pseudomyrmex gracilis TaxID=219809 RepID=UPI000994C5B1